MGPMLSLLALPFASIPGCRTEPAGPVAGDVVIAFQSRGEGEIEPCG